MLVVFFDFQLILNFIKTISTYDYFISPLSDKINILPLCGCFCNSEIKSAKSFFLTKGALINSRKLMKPKKRDP